MGELLSAVLAFPTVVFTVLLGLVLLYWTIVLFGLLDMDILDPGGGIESGVDGALDATGAEGVDAGDADAGGIARGLQALGLAQAPLTVSLSILIFFGWMGSFLGMRVARGLVPAAWFERRAIEMTLGIGIGFVAVLVGFYLTLLVLKPLRPVFALHNAPLRASFVGKLCTITSATVDARSGQAEIDDGGAGLRVGVRCFEGNDLGRGSMALLYDYDPRDEVFHVSPANKALRNSG